MANKRDATAVRSVKSAERVLTLLETIGITPAGTTFSQLNANLRIPKSSLHALLEVLTSRDYIELDPDTRRYSLGVRVWETGYAYHRHHGVLKQAQEVLEKVVARVNETVQFAKLVGSENVYLAKVDSTHPLRLQSDVGARLQAHATGIGKVLLAQLDDEEVRRRFVRKDLPVYTANTIPTVSALLDELAIIRQRGFAIDNEEYSLGVFCAAVPVFGTSGPAKNALSVSVPIIRATQKSLSTILAAIAEGSIEISTRVGSQRTDPLLLNLSRPAGAAEAVAELVDSRRYKLVLADEALPLTPVRRAR